MLRGNRKVLAYVLALLSMFIVNSVPQILAIVVLYALYCGANIQAKARGVEFKVTK